MGVSTNDIIITFLIIISFFITGFTITVLNKIKEIRNNWDEHKCNPMVMPFASFFGKDAVETFSICIAQTQQSLMKHFLGPIEHTLGMAANLGGNMIKDMQSIRILLKNSTFDISKITNGILGNVFNMRGAISGLFGSVKQIISKVIGVFIVIIHILKSTTNTGTSMVNGPIGEYFCFNKDTKIKLKDNNIVKIKDIKLGNILGNGSKVIGILNLQNHYNEVFYKIYSEDLNEYIYITGDHLIFNKNRKKFIKVKYHEKSIKTDIMHNELSCLITDNHRIPVGEYIFWDWED